VPDGRPRRCCIGDDDGDGDDDDGARGGGNREVCPGRRRLSDYGSLQTQNTLLGYRDVNLRIRL
jgi:hypothetical protein